MATKCACPVCDCKTTIFYTGEPGEIHYCSRCENKHVVIVPISIISFDEFVSLMIGKLEPNESRKD